MAGVGEHRQRVGEQADHDLDDQERGNEPEGHRERPPVGAQPRVLVAVSVHGAQAIPSRRQPLYAKFTSWTGSPAL